MQHNIRDPLRDHTHGRIYRVTYPSRPLVTPSKIDGASIPELLNNLTLPEYRTRYRTLRELREHPASAVLPELKKWIGKLDKNSPQYEKLLLEALWVSWGQNKVDQPLLRQLLKAKDYRIRAAAVEVVRFSGNELADKPALLMGAAKDDSGRVRIEAIVAASWLSKEKGLPVILEAGKKPLDSWMIRSHAAAEAHINGLALNRKKQETVEKAPTAAGIKPEVMAKGKAIYMQDGYCNTCHQADGKGLEAAGFPPLNGSKWVTGNEDRLIKLVMKGLYGPIEVNGKQYPGQVPMTPYAGMLKDDEMAAVLTYVRNAFGNKAPAVTPEKVKAIRASIKDKTGFYTPDELLKLHPMEK
jgi:mono/diheme cytochrome c family protein